MTATASTMLPLGTPLPEFRLMNAVDRAWVTSQEALGAKGLVVMFICNHCPYVIHLRKELVKAAHEFRGQGLGVIAINSNNAETHPEDGPEAMRRLAVEEAWKFPFLYDERQEVAQAFKAACTPDFYLFNAAGKLIYRGQFDDSRPSSGAPVTGKDLRAAVEALASGTPLSSQKPSVGCNIKWLPGKEPGYFR